MFRRVPLLLLAITGAALPDHQSQRALLVKEPRELVAKS